uniref:Putative rho-associated protein kinase 1 n=1 Tax=Triatoma infestans TaxID=30076 RepID=A0A023F2E1_TRIIF
MFENWVSTFRNKSNRITGSISVENFKLKTSETLDNIKTSLFEKTNGITAYFRETQGSLPPPKTTSTPNLNLNNVKQTENQRLKWPILVDNKMVWVEYDKQHNSLEVDNDLEENVVDNIIRVITIDDNSNNRRNDREEIRRRLATGCDSDEYYGSGDKPGKKPSLQARLQSGMNLQICFMNETSSDTESPSSESPSPSTANITAVKSKLPTPDPPKGLNFSQWVLKQREPQILTADPTAVRLPHHQIQAVAQNKEPVLPLIVRSLNRVGVTLPEGRRRVTRQILTNMNVAQLQVIVNDLHTHIEQLNEGLMSLLMERDELHMSQDSMLVDIEDITRFLSAKESYLKEDTARNNNVATTTTNASNVTKQQTTVTKPVITRIVSLGKK